MSKEVTNVENTELATFDNSAFESASDHDVSASEIVIPKLILAQPGSPKVLEGDWAFGDLRSTLDDELMASAGKGGKPGKTLEFIPIHHQKFWIIKVLDGPKAKFETMEPITNKNANLNPFETWTGPDGQLRKREFLHLFYILVPGRPLPFTLGFRGTSKRNGDKLVTQCYVMNKMIKTADAWKRSPFAKAMVAMTRKESKNDNNYTVLDVAVSRDATYEEACEALQWFQQIKQGDTRIDNSDIESEGKFTDPDSLAF